MDGSDLATCAKSRGFADQPLHRLLRLGLRRRFVPGDAVDARYGWAPDQESAGF